MTGNLTLDSVRAALRTGILGSTLEVHSSIASTNTRAAELARSGAPEGTLVIADVQTAGRGRLGRSWLAPPGSSLLFSLVLRPALQPAQMQRLAMLTSLSVCCAVEALYGIRVTIKWPNDLQITGRKLGGMLCEAGMRGSELDYVVVGLGLNVNVDPASLGPLLTPATSLAHELGHEVERLPLLAALLLDMERYYLRLREGWLPHADWRARLATLGQPVRAGLFDEVMEGTAEDIDADGALLLRLADGSLRRVLAGDVTLRGYAL